MMTAPRIGPCPNPFRMGDAASIMTPCSVPTRPVVTLPLSSSSREGKSMNRASSKVSLRRRPVRRSNPAEATTCPSGSSMMAISAPNSFTPTAVPLTPMKSGLRS